MTTVERLLQQSGVLASPRPTWTSGGARVYASKAQQLFGTQLALRQYVGASCAQYGAHAAHADWQAQPILAAGVHAELLDPMRTAHVAEPRDRQLCVLIPKAAHQRIAAILGSSPGRTLEDVLLRHRLAHASLGDYTGAGPGVIEQELEHVLRTALRGLGVAV